MKHALRTLWRRSWWVTLPVTIVFAFWLEGTLSRWRDFHLHRSTADPLTLVDCGELEARHMVREAIVGVTSPRKWSDVAATGLRTVRLYVPEPRLAQLNADLPGSGREYVEGGLEYGGEVREVDVRYRGDNVYHWGYWKKSWRIKTKRKDLFDGMRKFNLIAPRTPEVVNNYLACRLATHFGLIVPKVELCNVELNGRLLGLYVLTEQLDESTVRRHRRMPGDVYSGEVVGRDHILGARARLFDHPGVWTKVAVNNHFAEDADAPLRALTHHIQRAADEESAEALSSLLDVDAFARFSVFEALACTVHIDTIHNWRLYYDPWRTRFEPVVWDPVGWFWTMRPRPSVPLRPDVVTSELHVALFRDADFLRARSRAFRSFFEDGRADEFLREARAAVEALGPSLDLDPHLVAFGDFVHPRRAKAEAARLMNDIEGLFASLDDAVGRGAPAQVRWVRIGTDALRVEVSGRRTVAALRIHHDGSAPTAPRASIGVATPGWISSVDVSGATSIDDEGAVVVEADLIASHRLSITSMEPEVSYLNGLFVEPAGYGLGLDPSPGAIVRVEWRPEGETEWRPADEIEAVDLTQFRSPRPPVTAVPVVAPSVWSGEQLVDGLVEIDGDLVVEPGTRVRLAAGATVLVRGRLTAVGDADRPITFEPARPGQAPWGAFALLGRGADGSRLAHCAFRGGSGWKVPLMELSAMLSVHDVDDVVVANCLFEDGRVVDDMVHGVYSDIVFRGCTFRRALSDALDMDISEVVVDACTFEDSGNDAIDLMTTEAIVVGTRLASSGDKGISIGEGSRAVAVDCRVDACAIGVQSKDDSRAVLANCDFVDCGAALDAYKKNWRYDGGGTIHAYKSRIERAGRPAHADRDSLITLGDCFLDREPEGKDAKRVLLTDVDDASRTLAARGAFVRSELDAGDAAVESLLERVEVDASRRGSSLAP